MNSADGTPAALLEVRDLTASYGPFKAVFGVSFSVPGGRATALLGPNGAGKTTVARAISGLISPERGHIWFNGTDIAGQRAYRIARLGIAHATEGRSVFASLTVEENLSLAFRRNAKRAALAAKLASAYDLFPRLGERRSQLAGTLSGGEQRMLSLARVLVDPPKLLVVDELSLGLAPVIVSEVYEKLALIKTQGTTLLIIEQYVEQALKIADDAVVMNRGEVVYAGPPTTADELASHFLIGS
ncbi:MAG: ABC transporter ATP-binding protein [Acidimicrobiales bacterium]|nr:ABC transporter ATP-binding protein [Acidimicrobiales bacterium]